MCRPDHRSRSESRGLERRPVRLVGGVLLAVAAAGVQAQTITTFDAPDAGTSLDQGTQPIGISSAGEIAGTTRTRAACSTASSARPTAPSRNSMPRGPAARTGHGQRRHRHGGDDRRLLPRFGLGGSWVRAHSQGEDHRVRSNRLGHVRRPGYEEHRHQHIRHDHGELRGLRNRAPRLHPCGRRNDHRIRRARRRHGARSGNDLQRHQCRRRRRRILHRLEQRGSHRAADGTITGYTDSKAGTSLGQGTRGTAINKAGAIAGHTRTPRSQTRHPALGRGQGSPNSTSRGRARPSDRAPIPSPSTRRGRSPGVPGLLRRVSRLYPHVQGRHHDVRHSGRGHVPEPGNHHLRHQRLR